MQSSLAYQECSESRLCEIWSVSAFDLYGFCGKRAFPPVPTLVYQEEAGHV